MIQTWFNTPEKIAALGVSSRSWLGTPFFRASSTKGQGVDCSHLVAAIYREVEFRDIQVPDFNITSPKLLSRSVAVPFISGLTCFAEITTEKIETGDRYGHPGDLLGIRVGRVVHHLGILVDWTMFIHVTNKVTFNSILDATWASRLSRVWRPQP